jgi:hypothetical protein
MAATIEPLATAAVLFFIGAATIRLFQYEEYEIDEMTSKIVFRLLLGPLCFAVFILVLDGVANHLRLIWLVQP